MHPRSHLGVVGAPIRSPLHCSEAISTQLRCQLAGISHFAGTSRHSLIEFLSCKTTLSRHRRAACRDRRSRDPIAGQWMAVQSERCLTSAAVHGIWIKPALAAGLATLGSTHTPAEPDVTCHCGRTWSRIRRDSFLEAARSAMGTARMPPTQALFPTVPSLEPTSSPGRERGARMALQNILVEQRAPRRNDGYRKPLEDDPQAIAGDVGHPPRPPPEYPRQSARPNKRVRQTRSGPHRQSRRLSLVAQRPRRIGWESIRTVGGSPVGNPADGRFPTRQRRDPKPPFGAE